MTPTLPFSDISPARDFPLEVNSIRSEQGSLASLSPRTTISNFGGDGLMSDRGDVGSARAGRFESPSLENYGESLQQSGSFDDSAESQAVSVAQVAHEAYVSKACSAFSELFCPFLHLGLKTSLLACTRICPRARGVY